MKIELALYSRSEQRPFDSCVAFAERTTTFDSSGLDPHSALPNCAGASTEQRMKVGTPALLVGGLAFARANACSMGMLLNGMPRICTTTGLR